MWLIRSLLGTALLTLSFPVLSTVAQAPPSSSAVSTDSSSPSTSTSSSEDEPNGGRTFEDTLVVTASRTEEPLRDAPSSVTVVSREELAASPATTLDEALRQIAGFSLFRRTSSLDAHPTTQGVSLRGIGPSGTSRSLVLLDGIPLNDPFGGWVVWNRVPVSSLERVEVARGAGSPLWGSSALGGTIHLRSRRSHPGTLEISVRGGERDLADVEVFAGGRLDRSRGRLPRSGTEVRDGQVRDGQAWHWTLAGRALRSGGFFVLAPDVRGAVDRPVGVDLGALTGRLDRGGYHLGAQLYREERSNGTELQTNDTGLVLVNGGFQGERWSWTLHGQWQRFESTFSRVFPGRDREIRTAVQSIPATSLGGSVTLEPARVTGLLVGLDARRATWRDGAEAVATEDGEIRDDWDPDLDQDLVGAFVQKSWRATEALEITAGARLDRWNNRSTQTAVSPRLGAVLRAGDGITVRASTYRGFRAPTLNELFRPFRVGNVITAANPDLSEERLTGIEVGADFHPRPRGRSHPWGRRTVWGRLNLFFNRLDDPVGNVTVAVEPDRILRQRRNLGEVEVPGFEAEGNVSWGNRLRLRGAYLFSNPTVESTGRRLPQVPRHQATLRLAATGPWRLSWTVEGRWSSEAFEDDLEQLPLGEVWQVDAAITVPLRDGLAVTLAAENLMDGAVIVGRLPEERLGEPRTVWLGLSWRRGSNRSP